MNCRHCETPLKNVFLDLETAPPSNNYLTADELKKPEKFFPLRLFVCGHCWLVQTEDFSNAEDLFRSDYAYFSSTSSSWLEHAARYTDMIVSKFNIGSQSHVVELASNDGYLLKNFVAKNIPCLGIEPTKSTAEAAQKLGIPVMIEFFGKKMAERLVSEGKKADLVIGNNVYAHVPDINDFTAGIKTILKPDGIVTLEFPHLLQLITHCQFDTVYHEHFSYLSLSTTQKIFAAAGLRVFDVEELPTHGGSLRVYGCLVDANRPTSSAVENLIAREREQGLFEFSVYQQFQKRVDAIKQGLLDFLTKQKKAGRTVAAYGAAAKGNTLLNYAGVKPDMISFVCDAAPAKQNKFMPGSHIPIYPPAVMYERKPDFVMILPWNIAPEVMKQLHNIRDWGGQFVVAVPKIQVT